MSKRPSWRSLGEIVVMDAERGRVERLHITYSAVSFNDLFIITHNFTTFLDVYHRLCNGFTQYDISSAAITADILYVIYDLVPIGYGVCPTGINPSRLPLILPGQ